MKCIISCILLCMFATACLTSCPSKCGLPSCQQCATVHEKITYLDHYVVEEAPKHPYCGVPTCNKCVKTVTCKPKCAEVPEYQNVYTFEEDLCPEGYYWNGYFCAVGCKCKTHKPSYY
ncbi:uncharacterized protein LOC120894404 [Anopheles arabiensis]|uniref:uncharacterized protein LOC120894404 n=1 Tax=Anopheles arabiensis TaxID=7173 RepID=UPI001AACBED8|nr:uncharacterized protein LOC120894404 [Anopheles arabiensis]